MTDTPDAETIGAPQMDPARLVLLSECLDTLLGPNRDTDLQMLRLVKSSDRPFPVVYILVSPHGLTNAQWEEVLEEAFRRFVHLEEDRLEHDLSDFTEDEIAAYDHDNLRGLIVLFAARRGWTVLPVQDRAWGESSLEI